VFEIAICDLKSAMAICAQKPKRKKNAAILTRAVYHFRGVWIKCS
jgi:hypothetical protein